MKIFSLEKSLKIILLGIVAVLIVVTGILASVPPVSRDALTHHLAVPKLYLKHGGMYEIPAVVFSYYPMNLDLLYLIPLYFGNDILPKFLHFMFALLTAWLIYGYLKKRLGAVWALFGAIFFLSLPIIVKLSITVYVDLGLVFFSTAAIMSLFRWIESRLKIKFLVLSAVCCGLALGTKYNGLIVLFILTVFIPFIFIGRGRGRVVRSELDNLENPLTLQLKAIGSSTFFCLIALLVFSPWMIRNYVWQGNPIYPLYGNVFNPKRAVSIDIAPANEAKEPDESKASASRPPSLKWSSFAIRKIVYNEPWWEIALIPVRIFFQGQDDNPKYFDGKLSPFLFFLPLLAFVKPRNHQPSLITEKRIFTYFAVLYLLYVFSQTDMRIRYIAPIIPPMVILSIFGLQHVASEFNDRWKNAPNWFSTGCSLLLVGVLFTYNGIYIFDQFNYVKPFSYLSGQVSRDEYIARYRPENFVIQHINRKLPESAKILALFLGNRGYYIDRKLIFGDNLFKKIIKNSETPAVIREKLRKMDFTHLLIRYDLFNHWAEKQFSILGKEKMIAFFEKHVIKLYSQAGYGLFIIR